MEDGLRKENIQFDYKIYNNGPSTIKELNVAIQVPSVYMPKPNYRVPLIDFNELNIRGFYVNKVYDVTWMQDNKVILPSLESTTNVIVDLNNLPSHNFGYDYGFENKQDEMPNEMIVDTNQQHRRRRSPKMQEVAEDDDRIFRVYNVYTGSIDEYHSSYRIETDKLDETLKNLPKNRTIFFDCSDEEEHECWEARFTIHNVRPGNEPISITMNFTLDLSLIGKLKIWHLGI